MGRSSDHDYYHNKDHSKIDEQVFLGAWSRLLSLLGFIFKILIVRPSGALDYDYYHHNYFYYYHYYHYYPNRIFNQNFDGQVIWGAWLRLLTSSLFSLLSLLWLSSLGFTIKTLMVRSSEALDHDYCHHHYLIISCRSAAEGGTHGGAASQAWEVAPCREESNLPGAKSLCKEKVSRLSSSGSLGFRPLSQRPLSRF